MTRLETLSIKKFDTSISDFSHNDHYTLMWMKKGFKSVQIDFESFDDSSDSIYFITSGRKVKIQFEGEPEGWILRFSREYFKTQIREQLNIKHIDIFSSFGKVPKMILSPQIGKRVHSIAEMIDELKGSDIPNKEAAVASLLKTLIIYCDSKCNIKITHEKNSNEVQIVIKFKELVARHYTQAHKVSEYADMMNLSPKYLNQVVKNVLGMTAKQIIHDQLVIQARRELKFSNDSVKEIAFRLGFSEPFHFSNYFKKMIGYSPSEYRLM